MSFDTISYKIEGIQALIAEIEEKINKTVDIQQLSHTKNALFKALHGEKLADQVKKLLSCEGIFSFEDNEGKEHFILYTIDSQPYYFKSHLQNLLLNIDGHRIAFELDESFLKKQSPYKNIIKEYSYFENKKKKSHILVRIGYNLMVDDDLSSFVASFSKKILKIAQEVREFLPQLNKGSRYVIYFDYQNSIHKKAHQNVFGTPIRWFSQQDSVIESNRAQYECFEYDTLKLQEKIGLQFQGCQLTKPIGRVKQSLKSYIDEVIERELEFSESLQTQTKESGSQNARYNKINQSQAYEIQKTYDNTKSNAQDPFRKRNQSSTQKQLLRGETKIEEQTPRNSGSLPKLDFRESFSEYIRYQNISPSKSTYRKQSTSPIKQNSNYPTREACILIQDGEFPDRWEDRRHYDWGKKNIIERIMNDFKIVMIPWSSKGNLEQHLILFVNYLRKNVNMVQDGFSVWGAKFWKSNTKLFLYYKMDDSCFTKMEKEFKKTSFTLYRNIVHTLKQ